MKRIFLIVLDSFGVGALPDSESFGDVGVNTLAACATSSQLQIPTMIAAGLGLIDGVSCLPKPAAPRAPMGVSPRHPWARTPPSATGNRRCGLPQAHAHLSQRLSRGGLGALPGSHRAGNPL